MAYTTIKNSSAQFNANTFTGNNSTQTFTGFNFQPDMTWLKKRNGTANHHLVNAVSGVGYYLYPNLTNVQGGNGATLLTAFTSDGYTVDAGADSNGAGATGVGWSWKAGNLANTVGTSNGDGSITSSVSANTVGGFSIVKYTGDGSSGATVGHGLGATPKVIIVKRTNTTAQWNVYHASLGNTGAMYLNTDAAFNTVSGFWNNTSPNSTTFTLGNDAAGNGSGDSYVAYCWTDKVGYSNFGKYVGNNNTDGTFVYTGFKPAFVMMKVHDGVSDWSIFDNKRLGYNTSNRNLKPNSTAADETIALDLLSNGFKPRSTSDKVNNGNYIYIAFAAEPLVGDNPATAR